MTIYGTKSRVLKIPRFRFRLRTLLAVTALMAIALTFLAREVREWRRRERARQQRAQLLNMGDFPGDIPLRRGRPFTPVD
ncbi:MAG: hypothetical protein ABUL64_01120 [Singulisphaera sp.]